MLYLNCACCCRRVESRILLISTLVIFFFLILPSAATCYLLPTELCILSCCLIRALEICLQFLLGYNFCVIVPTFKLANIYDSRRPLNVTRLISLLACYCRLLLSQLTVCSTTLISFWVYVHLRTDYKHFWLIFPTSFHFCTTCHLVCSGSIILVETVSDLKVL